MRAVGTAVFVAVAALTAPAAAWAHASLVSTDPVNGAVLARSPGEVQVTFDDPVRPGPGIAAIRNGGASILAGRGHLTDARTLAIPLRRGLADGDYSVRWSILSDDGHLESGVLAFAVGAGRAPPVAGLAPRATGPTVDTVGARWLFFAGVLGAAGLALFTFVVRPHDRERIPLVVSTAGVLAALGAAQEIHRVGLATRDGKALAAGFVVALVVASLAAAATLDRRALTPALVAALPLAVIPAFAGHALDPGLARINVFADAVHVVAAAAWVGVLIGVAVIRSADLRRSGALALTAIVVLAATGVTRAAFELTGLSQLWDTGYGRALLVKTALLLGALVLGWLLRSRARYRAGVELVLVAAIIVAVSVLVELRPGRNVVSAAQLVAQASQPSAPPPPPPAGALVLAHEAGPLGVAIEVLPDRVTAIVLSPAGGGLSGLDIRIDGKGAVACGSGCYSVAHAPGAAVTVTVAGFGPVHRLRFAVPAHAPAADRLLRRATTAYLLLRGVSYIERLAYDEKHAIVAHWRLERPDRIEYVITGSGHGIVIGSRRWDRQTPRGPWVESSQLRLHQPAPQWSHTTNAHVIAQTAATTTVSFADPAIPAFFTVTLDRKSLRTRVMHMTAAAHFMTDTYVGFSARREIHPPR